jgi:hypothetical protein
MRKIRWLVFPVFLIFLLGCGLLSGVQDIQKTVSTQLPEILTSAPTAQGMIETIAAQQSTNKCTGTPTTGGLGVSVETAKTVLQMTQEFAFTDGTANGKPAVIATLTTSGATTFSAISQGFSAQFIGDVCNLSEVTVTIPRTDQQDTIDQGTEVLNIVLAGTLPPDVQLAFLTWVTENYSSMTVSGSADTTIKNMKFSLQRNQTSMLLDIVPVQ